MRWGPLMPNMAFGIDINGEQDGDRIRNMPRAGPGEFSPAVSSDT